MPKRRIRTVLLPARYRFITSLPHLGTWHPPCRVGGIATPGIEPGSSGRPAARPLSYIATGKIGVSIQIIGQYHYNAVFSAVSPVIVRS